MRADLTLAAIFAGFALDLIAGDPERLYHPVRIIGLLVRALEKILRRVFPGTKAGQRAAGALLCVLVFFVSGAVPFAFLALCSYINKWVCFAAEIIMCWQIVAVKSLRKESMKVCKKLECGNISGARKAVSMIVGRDTENLSEEGIIKAAVETVAESTSDGIIAPLFYLFIGGPVLGWMHKAANTMDSMLGYKNEQYIYFGTWAARLDDILNFIPARIAGALMSCCAFLCGLNGKGAWHIFCRDRKNHKSPNSAHTEAAMAGALGIRLGGDAHYFGQLVKKPEIGDPDRVPEIKDIRLANRLMYTTAVMSLIIFGLIRFLIAFLLLY